MSEVSGTEGVLAEFVALRQEIDNRTKYQWQVFALEFTFVGAVFSFAISNPEWTGLLLAIPYGSTILLGRYVAQLSEIILIARYIREELTPRLQLGWEQWIGKERQNNKVIRALITPHFLTFLGTSILAQLWTYAYVFQVHRTSLYAGLIAVAWAVGWFFVVWSLAILLFNSRDSIRADRAADRCGVACDSRVEV